MSISAKDAAMSYRKAKAWKAKLKGYNGQGYTYKKAPLLPVSLKRKLISTQSQDEISPLI
jgi:hypothetical protein